MGVDTKSIITDDRLKEVDMGDYNNHPVDDFPYDIYDINNGHEYGGETYPDVNIRLISFIEDRNINDKTTDKIIVFHALPIREMKRLLGGNYEKVRLAELYYINEISKLLI